MWTKNVGFRINAVYEISICPRFRYHRALLMRYLGSPWMPFVEPCSIWLYHEFAKYSTQTCFSWMSIDLKCVAKIIVPSLSDLCRIEEARNNLISFDRLSSLYFTMTAMKTFIAHLLEVFSAIASAIMTELRKNRCISSTILLRRSSKSNFQFVYIFFCTHNRSYNNYYF